MLSFTSSAWMMWNAMVSCLLLRCSIVMFDGDPNWPDLLEPWRLAQELRPTESLHQPRLPDDRAARPACCPAASLT